jgi:hypothetical protein
VGRILHCDQLDRSDADRIAQRKRLIAQAMAPVPVLAQTVPVERVAYEAGAHAGALALRWHQHLIGH